MKARDANDTLRQEGDAALSAMFARAVVLNAHNGNCDPSRSPQSIALNGLEKQAADQDLLEMNSKFAVVRVGGKTRVVSIEEDPTYPGCKVPVFSSINDFCQFHDRRKKTVLSEKGKTRRIGLGRWWIENEDRRQYDGIVYAPNSSDPTKLNLWMGFSCDPAPGDCDLYIAHLRDNVAAGNDDHAEYLLNWMARSVQQPGTAGEVAIVMRGKEGTGKGVLAREFGRLFGSHFRHLFQAKHLTGHFNSHLQQCSVLHADESFFAGDRSHESILKGLITEHTLFIEPKGLDGFTVRNCIHLLMSSNSDWVVPAGADARRYFVLNVSDTQMQNAEYFAAIAQQMNSGGREALLHFLLNRDISEFDPRRIPHTDALDEQKAFSRRGMDRLIEIIAHDGAIPAIESAGSNVAITTGEDKGEGFYHAAKALVPELKHLGSIGVAKALRKEWGFKLWKSGYRRGIEFPPMRELREMFDQKHGKQAWPDMDDWGSGT